MDQLLATRKINGIEAPATGTWVIDASHSAIAAVARHLMVAKVRGHFSSFAGAIHLAETPEDSWVEVEIDAASMDTGVEMRDNHLRSVDFLDVENHPKITFRSTKVELGDGNEFTVTGDLSIRGVTRPVTLAVEFEGLVTDPWGGSRAGFTAKGELNREDWGMTWNQALETGGVVVGPKLKVELDVEAVLQE